MNVLLGRYAAVGVLLLAAGLGTGKTNNATVSASMQEAASRAYQEYGVVATNLIIDTEDGRYGTMIQIKGSAVVLSEFDLALGCAKSLTVSVSEIAELEELFHQFLAFLEDAEATPSGKDSTRAVVPDESTPESNMIFHYLRSFRSYITTVRLNSSQPHD